MRDDLNKLPLPPEAKAYARRSGLSAMKKQPQGFINMATAVTNQKDKRKGFKNTDEVGTVPKAIKECATSIISFLLETEDDQIIEFRVYPGERIFAEKGNKICYNIQVPTPQGRFVNKIYVLFPLSKEGMQEIEQRMANLVSTRDYPVGSFFTTPWGDYLIHGGTISRI